MQQSEFVFAYGSNMDPVQMRERCPQSDLSWFVAEAKGWRLWFPHYAKARRKCAVGSIDKKENESVWGVVFAVTQRDLERLDRYEGKSYTRNIIDVSDQQGRLHRVWTYFWISDESPTKELPSKEYLGLYIRGAEYFGLPEQYRQSLKLIQTRPSKREDC